MISHCKKFKVLERNFYDFDRLKGRCGLTLKFTELVINYLLYFALFVVVNHSRPFLKTHFQSYTAEFNLRLAKIVRFLGP